MYEILGYSKKDLNALSDSISIFDCKRKAVENGCLFTVSGILTLTASTSIFVCGKSPSSKTVYMTLPIVKSSQPQLEIYAYKGTIYDDTKGSSVEKYNHNHQLDTPSTWQDFRAGLAIADISNVGNKFYEDLIPCSTGVGGTTTGGQTQERAIYKFDKDTNYCMQLKENSGNNNKLFFSIEWYEVEGGIF